MINRLRHLSESVPVLRARRGLEAHDRWSGERLRVHQRERLLAMIRYAATHSPYYRERFAGIELSDDLDLTALPRLDKAATLEHFDELVSDRRLTLARVERHMAELEKADPAADPKLHGEYRVMASGGTSGQRGIFVYGRSDWVAMLGGLSRFWNSYFGFTPRIPRRRMASLPADHPHHISGRIARSTDIGVFRILRLDARTPIAGLIDPLNAFQPECLNGYPSTVALLAERQLAGGLQIAPGLVTTTGEVLSAEMRERILAAWGCEPFDQYGATETGYMAAECECHAGLHLFEDQVAIEVVDEDYQPVRAGKPGSRMLVTNLFSRTQPLIRYELNDLITVSPDPCPCGRPFPLLKAVTGRSDDLLELPAADGGIATVHPVTLRSALAGILALSEYRITYRSGELHVDAVLTRADGRPACREIEARLRATLVDQRLQPPPIRVESVTEISRHRSSGKHKVIEVQAAP